jgi:hypothetical protein
MAEAAGLAVGVVALAGLFNNAVECFRFVQLGRAFEKDFKTAQLKLDACELRLSRWGASLGLNRSLRSADITAQTFGTEADVTHADDLLNQIVELFAEAEGVSKRFKDRAKPNSDQLALCDPHVALNTTALVLHGEMQKLSIKRQGNAGVKNRMKWALYEEKRFGRLLDDIKELVDNLIQLFPAGHAAQEKLCEEEASALAQNAEAALLKEIVSKQDKLLELFLDKALGHAERSQPQHVVFSGSNNQGSQVGFNSGTISNSFGGST